MRFTIDNGERISMINYSFMAGFSVIPCDMKIHLTSSPLWWS